jgi:hypothetical protein
VINSWLCDNKRAYGIEGRNMDKGYKNFGVAIYCQIRDVQRMGDLNWLESSFNLLKKNLKFNKVYLETYRDEIFPEKEDMIKIKEFFESKGIEASAGIAFVTSEMGYPRTFCYSNPKDLEKVKGIIKFSAEIFNEIILDDWYFTNCRCELCAKEKGDKSWTEYRLERLEEVSKEYIIKPAKSINPKVNLIIKYPNWYEHYQALGYNLDAESKMFDMIYAGTETRDPEYTQQHLQQYQSYAIMRYLENVKPGKNGGGWIDPYARRCLDRWAEQIMLTLFAKPREVTLYCYGSLFESIKMEDGTEKFLSYVAPVAGAVFEEADLFIDKLGQPIGVPCYKPYNSFGEDFIHNYIGMLGIPVELTPEFPYNSNTIFLAESAKFDNTILEKIKGQLSKGGNVIITSGLLRALQNRGFKDIVEIECTDRKIAVKDYMLFMDHYKSNREIIIPEIRYFTNDSWEIVTGMNKVNGYPILLQARYGGGTLYVLAVPDNFSDLYALPQEALSVIRQTFMRDFPVQLEAPSQICLFLYDNNTFIVKSFLPHSTRCSITIKKKDAKLRNLMPRTERYFREEYVTTRFEDRTTFHTFMLPGTHRIFRFE